ncbi:SH3 domain-containing protein [Nesterenkonia flava]|uniref:SH3 domain-containing protein n=1 Tax=Nesterenkonia flava TaxID=469799 RepID=A0ABU1FX34_9MICC|nr:SH3 domain-containing protein [Nesterenkonia flava]MDR5712713.1 SH3 domain-containing protein [Nesterenkonia flava]
MSPLERIPALSTAAVGLTGLLALTACGGDEEPAPAETVTETAPAPETVEPTGGEQDRPEDDDSGQESEETSAPEPTAEAETPSPGDEVPPGGIAQVPQEDLPGEDFEMYYAEGDELGVAGLDPDDAPLEVFAVPGEDSEVVGGLQPTDAVTVTGRQRTGSEDPDFGIWTEVQLADGYGWVEGGLFYFGATEDITDELLDDVPPAEDPQAIAEGVAERLADAGEDITDDDGEPVGPDWTLITTPEETGEDFYRIDVTGMMDDSVAGHRLFVTVEEQADGYALAQVERTLLCSRGVGESGLCS